MSRRFRQWWTTFTDHPAFKLAERVEGIWGIWERLSWPVRAGLRFSVELSALYVIPRLAAAWGIIADNPIDSLALLTGGTMAIWALIEVGLKPRQVQRVFLGELKGDLELADDVGMVVHKNPTTPLAEMKTQEAVPLVPVLLIDGPFHRLAAVDTVQGIPLAFVRVRNTTPDTVARNVVVQINDPEPAIPMSFPITLHRMHDNDKPFQKAHDLRYGESVTFDVIACGQIEPDMFYIYRADGDGDSQIGPEWMLSNRDNEIIATSSRDRTGWRFSVVATPDPPAHQVSRKFAIVLDGRSWPMVVDADLFTPSIPHTAEGQP